MEQRMVLPLNYFYHGKKNSFITIKKRDHYDILLISSHDEIIVRNLCTTEMAETLINLEKGLLA